MKKSEDNRVFEISVKDLIDQIISWSSDAEQIKVFNLIAKQIQLTLGSGKKLIFFGNGGSAAEASHLAGEFMGKCELDIGPHPAIALNDFATNMTAISNDWNFESVFSRQILGLGSKGDFAIGLSTSGKSKNVIEGLKAAKKLGLVTSLWTSNLYNNQHEFVDFLIKAPSTRTPRIQELHLFIGHALCEQVEFNKI